MAFNGGRAVAKQAFLARNRNRLKFWCLHISLWFPVGSGGGWVLRLWWVEWFRFRDAMVGIFAAQVTAPEIIAGATLHVRGLLALAFEALHKDGTEAVFAVCVSGDYCLLPFAGRAVRVHDSWSFCPVRFSPGPPALPFAFGVDAPMGERTA
jgi:hypothetical protein